MPPRVAPVESLLVLVRMLRSLRSRNSSLTLPSSRYRRKFHLTSSSSSSITAILPSFIAASKRKGIWVGGNLPLGYEMKDGKIAVVEEEAELVRSIFRRNLELGSVNELVRGLRERNIRTKKKQVIPGESRDDIHFSMREHT